MREESTMEFAASGLPDWPSADVAVNLAMSTAPLVTVAAVNDGSEPTF